jgi:hypothetical protein
MQKVHSDLASKLGARCNDVGCLDSKHQLKAFTQLVMSFPTYTS